MLKRLGVPLASAILLLGLLTACGPATASGTGLVEGSRVGNLAYAFVLQDLAGNTVTLPGLRGRPVLLNFWSTS